MNTAPIIERLRAQCSGFKFIGGAMDFPETTLQSVNYPAAFCVPLEESAAPSQMLSTHDQRINQTWGIAIHLKAMRTTALDQSAQLHTLRASVRDALTGWTPVPATIEPFDFDIGRLIEAEAGNIVWQDNYSRATYYRNPAA